MREKLYFSDRNWDFWSTILRRFLESGSTCFRYRLQLVRILEREIERIHGERRSQGSSTIEVVIVGSLEYGTSAIFAPDCKERFVGRHVRNAGECALVNLIRVG